MGFPAGLGLVAGPGATATFDSSAVGSAIGITYDGYTLAGPNADQYALAGSCCVSTFRTTGTISAVTPPPPPPPPPPPVVIPPFVTPPDVFLPVSSYVTTLLAAGAIPGIPLAVIGGGVEMPIIELASAPAAEEKPVRRASSPHGPNAFLPAKPPLQKPVVPVHPRKQARN